MKKMIALVLALMMVLGLATTASAANVTNATPGHTYDAYQVFSGTQAENDPALAGIEWGTGVKSVELLAALKANYDYFDDCTSAADVANVLKGKADECDEANALAKIAANYLTTTKTPIGSESTVDLAAGYWLLVDTTDVDDKHDAKNHDVPTVEKKVYDINDTTGGDEVREDSADHDIGDHVPFQIVATLGDRVTDYTVYQVTFHDTMAKGLTLDATYSQEAGKTTEVTSGVTVKIDGADKTAQFKITAVTNAETGVTSLTIHCADVKALGATNNSEIVIDYTATLNNDAALGYLGNENKVKLEFSNDPNWIEMPGDNPPPPPTGETPEDKVVVFTYQIEADKVDPDGEALPGATFTLYKKLPAEPEEGEFIVAKDDEGEDAIWAVVGVVGGNSETTFTWKGVDDGDYMLVETVTPAGYNTIDPIFFTITAEHDNVSADPHLTELTGGVFTPVLDENDNLTGVLKAEIENLPGAVLPETGGAGTTIFYIIGGLLVAAAVVLLVTKKRMTSAE